MDRVARFLHNSLCCVMATTESRRVFSVFPLESGRVVLALRKTVELLGLALNSNWKHAQGITS